MKNIYSFIVAIFFIAAISSCKKSNDAAIDSLFAKSIVTPSAWNMTELKYNGSSSYEPSGVRIFSLNFKDNVHVTYKTSLDEKEGMYSISQSGTVQFSFKTHGEGNCQPPLTESMKIESSSANELILSTSAITYKLSRAAK